DEAFAARGAVVDMRERAGLAGCTILIVTGVAVEEWPRGGGGEGSSIQDDFVPAQSSELHRSESFR
ncbi:MAG: hypothetical protein VX252_08030, partial [Myxococcota bacterium]|nr:hypothetical protein [Myxococcota bacterium]